jgi:hypothetical protein
VRHSDVTIPGKQRQRKKSATGRPLSDESVIQLTLMDEQIASRADAGAIRETIEKKRASVRADVALCDVQLIIDNPDLMAAMEDAVAKKNASIQADIAVHNALIEHIKRLRDFNASVAA